MSLILSGSDGLSDIDGSASTPAIRGTDTNTGIFFPAADTIAFAEGGAEVARFNSSGNLGIGTTTPSTKLNVFGASPSIYLEQDGGAAGNTQLRLSAAGGANTGSVRLLDKYIWASTSNGSQLNIGNDLTTAQVSIDSSGNLLVGTTGISTGTFKGIQCGVNSGGFGNYLSNNPAGTAGRNWSFGHNNADQYVVYGYNGTSFTSGAYIAYGGTSWTASSDERKKDIIEPITDAVNKVATLRAVIGKYKTDEEGTRRSFLIAQDVQAVLPEAVDASNPDNLGVQYTEVIPLLVAAIKEQQAIITDLKSRIETLEAK
jgi:hypothetical protein